MLFPRFTAWVLLVSSALWGISVATRYSYDNVTKVIDALSSHAHYDRRIRPYFHDRPVNITINMVVVHFGQIREKEMDFEVDVFFMQRWRDERLKHSLDFPILLDGKHQNLVWQPDTFVLNIKKASFHSVPAPNSYLSIHPDGTVRSSSRLTLVASCEMNLMDYPMDEQMCDLIMLSYTYMTSDVDYFWINEDKKKPVVILNEEMNEFLLKNVTTSKNVFRYPSGPWTHVTATFTYSRRIGYSLLQVYIPTMLIVALSWLSFWISKDAVPARVALCVTTILTIVTLMGSFRSQFPKVSYVKAIDVFLIVSFIFVFGCALEYVLVLLHSGVKKKGKKKQSEDGLNNDAALTENDKQNDNDHNGKIKDLTIAEVDISDPKETGVPRKRKGKRLHKTKQVVKHALTDKDTDIIDRLSRFMFPLVYGGFNAIYWLSYQMTSFQHTPKGFKEHT